MKKALIIIGVVVAVAVIVTLLVLKGWPGVLVGSGNLETRQYAFGNFTGVSISAPFDFEIRQSSSYSINVTADDNVIDHVVVFQDGQTLVIGFLRRLGIFPYFGSVTLRASLTMPQLHALTASGASHGTISGFSSTDGLDVAVSGASGVTGNVTAGNVNFDISGASTIELEGSGNDMFADVSGASRLNLDSFIVSNANVNVSGSSSGTINLDGRLDANISGASTLLYIGNPVMGTINVSGASTLRKM
jgi:hypothetical protein